MTAAPGPRQMPQAVFDLTEAAELHDMGELRWSSWGHPGRLGPAVVQPRRTEHRLLRGRRPCRVQRGAPQPARVRTSIRSTGDGDWALPCSGGAWPRGGSSAIRGPGRRCRRVNQDAIAIFTAHGCAAALHLMDPRRCPKASRSPPTRCRQDTGCARSTRSATRTTSTAPSRMRSTSGRTGCRRRSRTGRRSPSSGATSSRGRSSPWWRRSTASSGSSAPAG